MGEASAAKLVSTDTRKHKYLWLIVQTNGIQWKRKLNLNLADNVKNKSSIICLNL